MPIFDPSGTNTIQNINLLKPDRFLITIDRKEFAPIVFFAQKANLPSVTVEKAQTQRPRIAEVPFPGDTIRFSELNVTMLLDEDLDAYSKIYEWMKDQVESNYVPKSSLHTKPTEASVTLSILNSNNNPIKRIRYLNAFPTMLGDIEMDASADAGITVVCPVNFAYTYFVLE